jgi:hypothetical protein
LSLHKRSLNLVCALDVDHNSSVLCNAIGYPNLITDEESPTQKPATGKNNNFKKRHQRRQCIHQWICIQDIIDGLITCNYTLKNKNINEILIKINRWIKQRNESNQIQSSLSITNIKLFKAKARQLVWDLMEMK